MGADGGGDAGLHFVQMAEQFVQDLFGTVLVSSVDAEGQKAGVGAIGVLDRLSGDDFPQKTCLQLEGVGSFVHGVAVHQQIGVGLHNSAGIVRVLVDRARHDLIVRFDVEVSPGGPDVVGIQIAQHGVRGIGLCILQRFLGVGLCLLVAGGVQLVLTDGGIVVGFFLAVFRHGSVVFFLRVGRDGTIGGGLDAGHGTENNSAGQSHRQHLAVFAQHREQQGDEVDLFLLLVILVGNLVFRHGLLLTLGRLGANF